jgi:hypothetical protein
MTSVMRHYRFKSCKYKKPYTSLKVGLDMVLEKRKNGIDVDSVYRCVFCDKYHIGHYPNQSNRNRHVKIINTFLKEQKLFI